MFKKLRNLFLLSLILHLFFYVESFSNVYRYVKETSKIYKDENKEKEVGKIKKSTRVNLIESKEIEKEKIKKEKKVILKYEISKISYKNTNDEKIVWIDSKNLVEERKETIRNDLKDLDFFSEEKLNFHNNKRIKVKGIYVSANSVALKGRLDELIKLAKNNGINAFVIDVKDDFGKITFPISKEVEKYSEKANKKISDKKYKRNNR